MIVKSPIPIITHTEFLVLAYLLKQSMTGIEIHDQFPWQDRSAPGFYTKLRKMVVKKLITMKWVSSGEGKQGRARLYAATASGKKQFVKTRAFYKPQKR